MIDTHVFSDPESTSDQYTKLMKLQNVWNDNYSTIQCTLKFMCISNRYYYCCCCCYYYCVKNFILSAAILSTLYFRQPFFAPVCLHVLLAAIKELKRHKAERAKYSAFLASRAASSWSGGGLRQRHCLVGWYFHTSLTVDGMSLLVIGIVNLF